MRLTDLDPAFGNDPERGRMLLFRCPKCGHHHIGVPITVGEKLDGRWKIDSEDFATLTMEPSVAAVVSSEKDCNYHVTITNGEANNC